MVSGEKTSQGGKYQIVVPMSIMGIANEALAVPPNLDPNDQWWYNLVIAQVPTLLQTLKNQWIQNLSNGVSVQYFQLDYQILWQQNYIPNPPARTFMLTGTATIQFTDLTHPFGIDDLILALVIIAIITAIIAATVILSELILTAGPLGAIIGVGIIAVGVAIALIVLVGGSVGVSKKGVQVGPSGREGLAERAGRKTYRKVRSASRR